MQILRSHEYRRMPWKNGGGETTEIAVSPATGLDCPARDSPDWDNLDWRISMATVAVDGPFSLFPGIDRTLCILEGDGLRLAVADASAVSLTTRSAPFAFPADVPARASLLGKPVADLNVMTRRQRYTHGVRRLQVQGLERVAIDADVVAVLCHSGRVAVETSNANVTLDPLDSVIDRASSGAWTLAAAAAVIFVVEIKSWPR